MYYTDVYTHFACTPTLQTHLKKIPCRRIISAHTHTHTFAISRNELRPHRHGAANRAEHIHLACGVSSPLLIAVASLGNIAQRCAANAALTHQRNAANSSSSMEPRSPVTDVPS